MGLVVHLTDLHLGAGGASSPADDVKLPLISAQDRMSVREIAEEQLQRLATVIRARGEAISALVLSGDITVRGRPEGYAALADFLSDSFGDLLPPPDRIVATPGNHDVTWYETDPTKRYEQFIAHCVKRVYVTPPLDGIDLKTGSRWKPGAKNVLIDREEGWFIAPINSSNWSGTRVPLLDERRNPIDEAAIDALQAKLSADPDDARIFEQLQAHRQFDMPRVSKEQLGAFKRTVEHARLTIAVSDPLAIAVIHHQLSPVNEREELKPFESLSNLGRVRSTLEDARIAVVLHGHKHDHLTMWNSTERGSQDGRSSMRHDMLVVSGGTIGGSPAPDPSKFATVLELPARPQVDGRSLGAHGVQVRSAGEYIADGGGTKGYFLAGRRIAPVSPVGDHIEANTFDAAYERLVAEGMIAGDDPVKNLSVTVLNVGDVADPPAAYPHDAVGSDDGLAPLRDWYRDVTRWWQSELIEAPRGVFTHGRRLKLHPGKSKGSQIAAVRKLLEDRRPTNGRLIATLIDASTDILGDSRSAPASFPAFCLVQFHLSSKGSRSRLHATAYFRKQEMRYWWPVNVSEIKLVMGEMMKGQKDMELGSITTMAAVAVWQTTRSRVSIPMVDRLYLRDEAGRKLLLRMVAGLAQPKECLREAERVELRSAWANVLQDIVPPEKSISDSIPVAVEGIRFLQNAADAHASVAPEGDVATRLRALTKELGTLAERGRSLWELGRRSDATNDTVEEQLSRDVLAMEEARDGIRRLLEDAFDGDPDASIPRDER